MKKPFILFITILLIAFNSSPAQTEQTPPNETSTDRNFLAVIKAQAEFDELARVYHQGTPYALPHVMFLIDRRDGNKIYYINSKKFRFHKDFANATYLSLERGEDFTNSNYLSDNRRLIMGTIAWQTPVKKWTFEFWEGDRIPADQIKLTYDVVNGSFFAPVAFKPNSTSQDEASAGLGINRISADEINKGLEYLALNTARGIGRIHIIDKLDDTVDIGYNEILVLNEVPISLPPVSGLIIARPSTPLSHINLLAKGWNIPNAYIKYADQLFREYDNRWVEFETTLTGYSIKPCGKPCLDEWDKIEKEKDRIVKSPPTDLSVTKLAVLSQQRKKDSIVYGGKSANLGEIINARVPGLFVPNGFSVPFYYYDRFMKENGFDKKVEELLDDHDFVHNPRIRREKLKEFRAAIQNGRMNKKLETEIVSKWKLILGAKPVYVRSSSNSEDLPNFSGAGLYSSVKNVVNQKQIIEAVKTVWASLWNFEAFEARERGFIDHTGVYMAVLIQTGVVMDDGGVMITRDPFNPENKDSVYISATFGHNLPVTGGDGEVRKKVIPEQILFTAASDSIQVLTRSDQDVMFVPDLRGGLKAVPFNNDRRVLSNAMARKLVTAANKIKRIFGGAEQDIEWGVMKGQIYIIQSRPYIDPTRPRPEQPLR
ncbi:MAG: PEP/pyruvate-binding domain-containing protein [Acidobacteria bacterium]|nr:PEP/pyruvate-binding domain-containing protein [Acidobacteriota bacterium]